MEQKDEKREMQRPQDKIGSPDGRMTVSMKETEAGAVVTD